MLLKINVRWDVNDDANVDDDDATRLIIDVPELRLMKKRRDTTYTRSASARTALSLSSLFAYSLSLALFAAKGAGVALGDNGGCVSQKLERAQPAKSEVGNDATTHSVIKVYAKN